VMNGCLIYAEGRFRTPGTKYTSYSIKSTPRGSAQGSRRSLNSAKTQKSNISDRNDSGRPSKPKVRERSGTSMESRNTSGSRYNSGSRTAIGHKTVERRAQLSKVQTGKTNPLGNKVVMPNLMKSTLIDSKNARSFRGGNVPKIRMHQRPEHDLRLGSLTRSVDSPQSNYKGGTRPGLGGSLVGSHNGRPRAGSRDLKSGNFINPHSIEV